jgi:chromatin assembly factor 1 subunit B
MEHFWKRGKEATEMVVTKRKWLGMFHNETLASFFRRLVFSPDGQLLLAPAGLIEDPETHSIRNVLFVYARNNLNK